MAALVLPNLSIAQAKTPKDNMIKYLDSVYRTTPKGLLDSITTDLDSTAISNQCFKFIFNKNKTKFIAFYIVEKKSAAYKSLKLEYGGSFRSFKNIPKGKGKCKALGYTVCGMMYNDKWCFDHEEYVRVTANTLLKAQEEFMFNLLNERKFFKNEKLKEDKAFWNSNGFLIEKTESGEKVPAMVLHANSTKTKREALKVNFKFEKKAQIVIDSIWHFLQLKDTNMYNARLEDKEEEEIYFTIYNEQRTKALLPIIFKDNKNQAWLSYYYFNVNDTTHTIYQWNAYPTRKIEIKQDQRMDIIKDIRKFSINWLWNTQNFLNDDEFWRDNFGFNRLETLK